MFTSEGAQVLPQPLAVPLGGCESILRHLHEDADIAGALDTQLWRLAKAAKQSLSKP